MVQVLLFLAFAMSGFMKLTMPIPELSQQAPWTADVPLAHPTAVATRPFGALRVEAAHGGDAPHAPLVYHQLAPRALVRVGVLAVGDELDEVLHQPGQQQQDHDDGERRRMMELIDVFREKSILKIAHAAQGDQESMLFTNISYRHEFMKKKLAMPLLAEDSGRA